MKTLFLAASALMLSSSAYAYQSYTTPTTPAVTVSVDPNVVLVAPPTWTAEQRLLWEQHMAAYPVAWTADQRAAFDAMMALPPASWTPEQRMLYEEHIAYLPPTWTDVQRTAYETQIAQLHEPWMTATQTASTDTYTTTTTTTTLASNLPAVVQPSNADPEHDARGIPVISDVAYVPPGFNGIAGGAMGGPSEGTDTSYPPCTRERTDNCTQTYEVGSNPR
jgi:hypothetical protein